MEIKIVKDYEEMSKMAADIFAAVINENRNCVLGLATGSTPVGMYDKLVGYYNEGKIDFSGVATVNLDEYYPISPDNEQSYRYFMNSYLFNKVNINKEKTFIPDGQTSDPQRSCEEYEKNIADLGGIDVQVLGIGRNGHIGFNEPDDGLFPFTHVTDLTQDTIEANARFFDDPEKVPRQALTMGIQSIFRARKIVVLASGEEKADAVKRMLSGKITTDCPASVLCLHPDVILICDKTAASQIQ